MATDCNYDMDRINHIGNDLVAAFNDGYQHGLTDARAERKTGKWEEYGEPNAHGKFEIWYHKCNLCGAIGIQEFSYCPNCGARMVTDDV